MREHLCDELLGAVFSGQEWRDAAEAMAEVSGATISVFLPREGRVLYTSRRCPCCELLHPSIAIGETGGWGCLGQDPPVTEGRSECFTGLPCYAGTVECLGEDVALMTVGGFVSTTRERKLLYERLRGMGIPEARACEATRKTPVLSLRRAEATLRALRAHAGSAVTRALQERAGTGARHEVEHFLDFGRELLDLNAEGVPLERRIVERALAVAGADSGVLVLRRGDTDLLEVVAVAGVAGGREPGQVLRIDDVPEGAALQTGSTHVAEDDGDVRSGREGGPVQVMISVSLEGPDRSLGSITVRGVPAGRATVEATRLLERFASVASSVLEGTRADRAARHSLDELLAVSHLAKALADCSNCDEVARVASSGLDRLFRVGVSGVALSAWGLDIASVSVRGTVTRSAFNAIISEAVGRDVRTDPFGAVRYLQSEGGIVDADQTGDERDAPVLSLPLTANGIVAGYAFAALPQERRFSRIDERMLSEAASHIELALSRAAEWDRLRLDHARTIAALAVALDSAERVERGHADRIAVYALEIGRELGLTTEDLHTLRFAAVVHDIGTLGIEPGIFGTPDPLTPEETVKMRLHPTIGAELVGGLGMFEPVTPAIMHHHERWDGTGYPAGLGGPEIPLMARVLAVADAFDAMTSTRSYRSRLTLEEARSELLRGSGTQFDPSAVRAFIQVLDRQSVAGGMGSLGLMAGDDGPQLPA